MSSRRSGLRLNPPSPWHNEQLATPQFPLHTRRPRSVSSVMSHKKSLRRPSRSCSWRHDRVIFFVSPNGVVPWEMRSSTLLFREASSTQISQFDACSFQDPEIKRQGSHHFHPCHPVLILHRHWHRGIWVGVSDFAQPIDQRHEDVGRVVDEICTIRVQEPSRRPSEESAHSIWQFDLRIHGGLTPTLSGACMI